MLGLIIRKMTFSGRAEGKMASGEIVTGNQEGSHWVPARDDGAETMAAALLRMSRNNQI